MDRLRSKEHYFYFFIIVVMSALYLYVRFFGLDGTHFGFDQLKHLKFRLVFVSYAFIGLVIVLAPLMDRWLRTIQITELREWKHFLIFAFAIAMISVILFFLFRNEFINKDGQRYARKFLQDIPDRGAHVTHDEMWELYLHSRFWFYTNRLFAWSVPFSFQVMSSFAGGIFIFLLFFAYYKNIWGKYLLIGVLSGGYMQLFFGDVENYTLVSVLLLLYFIVSWRFISGRHTIIVPVIVLATAITFHLLAGWLLPSLFVLYWWAFRRGEYKEIALSILYSVLIIGVTLLFFHYNGLPIEELYFNSHAMGHGGTVKMLVVPSLEHYRQIVNMLFLLIPPVLFFIPMILYKRIQITAHNFFLIVSVFCMLLLLFIWNPILGVYADWNLYAPGIIPLAILFWYNFGSIDDLKFKHQIFLGIFLISAIHTYSWIISNHFYQM